MRASRFIISAIILGIATLGTPTSGFGQIVLNQVDRFTDGTTMNWANGQAPSLITVPTDGGPTGTGDRFLRLQSTGAGGAGSRLTIFNHNQWLGDYTTANVNTIEMDLFNFSATALSIRIGFRVPPGGTAIGYSSTAFELPANSPWVHAVFPINSSTMSPVGNPALTLAQVLGAPGPGEFRILHAAAPSLTGDPVAAIIGVDNIAARFTPIPEPACVLVVGAVGSLVGLVVRRSRHRTADTPGA